MIKSGVLRKIQFQNLNFEKCCMTTINYNTTILLHC